MCRSKWLLKWSFVGIVIFLFLPILLYAQYFGQNKVQYQDYDFKIIKTKHFDVYYYDEEKEAALQASQMAERWYVRLSKLFNHDLSNRQILMLYASPAQFQQTNAINGYLGEGTGGVTEALKRRIVLPLAGPLQETDHVIGHELVHAFQYDMTGEKGGAASFKAPGALGLPLWFIEGMAEYFSLGNDDPNTAMWMRDAVKNKKKLPGFKDLNNPDYFPYRYGQAFLAYIGGIYGDDMIGPLLKKAAKDSIGLEKSIKKLFGIKADSLAKNWDNALRTTYNPIIDAAHKASDYGRLTISEKTGSGKINVAPVLSPDGHSIIFFSEKDLFSIDLYLADAETGEIKQKLVAAEYDPHLESLHFIQSAGAWNADGDKIAYAITTNGRPAISIFDMRQEKVTREIPLTQLDEIVNPAWSPDGHYIAFSALAGGVSDLFLYDTQQDSLIRLTHDLFADLQPQWSPDGKKLVFATDRFSTDLNTLTYGNIRLAMFDVSSRLITPLPSLQNAKNIDPQWTKNGKEIIFVSDYGGIDNIYKLNLEDEQINQITNLQTGISGITGLSPAVTVAANKMAFSVFENGKYGIYVVDKLDSLNGVKAGDALSVVKEGGITDSLGVLIDPAVLPPIVRKTDILQNVQSDYLSGLSNADSLHIVPYHPYFMLDYIGQPYLVAGADRYGTQFGGGISLFWSDVLGNHNLATMAQVQSGNGFTDVAGAVAYQNSAHRWNWGAVVQQIPYVLSQYGEGYGILDSNLVFYEQQYRWRQINREVDGFIAYPFDKASRVEFFAGYSHISFDQIVLTQAYDYYTGNRVLNDKQNLSAPASLSLFNSSLAYVYDNSFMGATGPLIGSRARFEFSPTVGSITLVNFLADYRHYFMPLRPFTLAFRLMHYGRYGGGAEDGRLTPMYIGYQNFVRGYNYNSLGYNEGDVFNHLIGSRIAVANAEIRFPLFGLVGLGHGYYGFLPLDTGVFYDTGVAWSDSTAKPFFLNGNRKPVRSYGFLARLNLFGYVVLELDYVKPMDRPTKSWYWQFNLSQGF